MSGDVFASEFLAAYVEKLRSEYVAIQKMIAELEQKIRQIKNSMAELENKKTDSAGSTEIPSNFNNSVNNPESTTDTNEAALYSRKPSATDDHQRLS